MVRCNLQKASRGRPQAANLFAAATKLSKSSRVPRSGRTHVHLRQIRRPWRPRIGGANSTVLFGPLRLTSPMGWIGGIVDDVEAHVGDRGSRLAAVAKVPDLQAAKWSPFRTREHLVPGTHECQPTIQCAAATVRSPSGSRSGSSTCLRTESVGFDGPACFSIRKPRGAKGFRGREVGPSLPAFPRLLQPWSNTRAPSVSSRCQCRRDLDLRTVPGGGGSAHARTTNDHSPGFGRADRALQRSIPSPYGMHRLRPPRHRWGQPAQTSTPIRSWPSRKHGGADAG